MAFSNDERYGKIKKELVNPHPSVQILDEGSETIP